MCPFRHIVCHAVQVGGCAPYFTITENGVKVFDLSKMVPKLAKYRKEDRYIDIDVSEFDCCLQGDIKVQLLHEKMPAATKICHLWFHTGYVAENFLAFSKDCIDKACKVRLRLAAAVGVVNCLTCACSVTLWLLSLSSGTGQVQPIRARLCD